MHRRARIERKTDASAPASELRLRGGEVRPFLKWVGGKRQLLPAIEPHLPRTFGTYHEPFVGGGAVFFHLAKHRKLRAFLSDANPRLVRAYLGVRDHVDEVIRLLRAKRHTRREFLDTRAIAIDERSDAEVAAWLIYLNKTAFNGLYRVNSKNEFNVPFGDYANPTICEEANLRGASELLARAEIFCEDFAAVEKRAKSGDLVYFDPPYVPLSTTSSFTSYTKDGFGTADHERLRDVARRLHRAGVHVILSNSSAALVRDLYSGPEFVLVDVDAARPVSATTAGRARVKELLIVGRR